MKLKLLALTMVLFSFGGFWTLSMHAKNGVGRRNRSSILSFLKDRIFYVGYSLQLRVGFRASGVNTFPTRLPANE